MITHELIEVLIKLWCIIIDFFLQGKFFLTHPIGLLGSPKHQIPLNVISSNHGRCQSQVTYKSLGFISLELESNFNSITELTFDLIAGSELHFIKHFLLEKCFYDLE